MLISIEGQRVFTLPRPFTEYDSVWLNGVEQITNVDFTTKGTVLIWKGDPLHPQDDFWTICGEKVQLTLDEARQRRMTRAEAAASISFEDGPLRIFDTDCKAINRMSNLVLEVHLREASRRTVCGGTSFYLAVSTITWWRIERTSKGRFLSIHTACDPFAHTIAWGECSVCAWLPHKDWEALVRWLTENVKIETIEFGNQAVTDNRTKGEDE